MFPIVYDPTNACYTYERKTRLKQKQAAKKEGEIERGLLAPKRINGKEKRLQIQGNGEEVAMSLRQRR